MASDLSLRSSPGSETEFQLLFDRTRVCIQAGPSGARPLGVDAAFLLGRPLTAIGLPAALSDRLDAQIDGVFATGHPLTRHLTIVASGELRDYALSFSPVLGLDATVAYVACIGQDVTDQPLSPLVLIEPENDPPPHDPLARPDPHPSDDAADEPSPGPNTDPPTGLIDAAADALDVGILVLDLQGNALTINPEAARLLDVAQDRWDKAQTFAPGAPFYAEDGSPLPLHELPWTQEGRIRPGACALIGRKLTALAFLWISVSVKSISDPRRPDEWLMLVTLQDVTQQRRAESQYLRQVANAERRSVVVDARNNHLSMENQQLARQNEALGTLATQDGLTTLKNHQAFQERLRDETRRALRTKEPLSLLILDVDYFKRFNDDHGHPAGDRMLRNIAETMLQTARTTDLVARYGGEEFAIILPETDAEGAYIIAERIRQAVEMRRWDDRAVTVSIGVSTLRIDDIDAPGEWSLATLPKQMIEEADRAMYKSKRGGRNRVMAYVPDAQSPRWLLDTGDAAEPSEAPTGEHH